MIGVECRRRSRRRGSRTGAQRRIVPIVMLAFLLGMAASAAGSPIDEKPAGEQKKVIDLTDMMKPPGGMDPMRSYASDASPGIEQKLGESVPLDLTFRDELGETVSLRQCIERPMVLTLVYLRCPSICSPLMHEVAAMVDKMDLEAGIDFDLLTVSFDINDTPELASKAKKNLLAGMQRKIPPESWRFLTGDAPNINALTDAVGFRYKRENQDFVHAGTVVFLTKDGKIVRYLEGLKLLPADMKMAVIDAADGRPRSLMQKFQRLCYAYDPEGKTYVFKVNRIVLAVTLFLVALFLGYLLLKKKGPRTEKGVT